MVICKSWSSGWSRTTVNGRVTAFHQNEPTRSDVCDADEAIRPPATTGIHNNRKWGEWGEGELVGRQFETRVESKQVLYGGWIETKDRYVMEILATGEVIWAENQNIEKGNVIACDGYAENFCFTWADAGHLNHCKYQVFSSNEGDFSYFIPLHGSNVKCPSGIFKRAQGSNI